MIVSFWIDGEPQSKGRPRFRRAGTFVQTYTPAKTLKAERGIKQVAGLALTRKLEGPLSMTVKALFTVPKSWSKAKREAAEGAWYTGKRDLDNVVKLAQDALNGVAYEDDRQIAHLEAEARYAHSYQPAGLLVELKELEVSNAQR